MKNILYLLIAIIYLSINTGYSQNNTITLATKIGGSEGNSKFTDNSKIFINSAGVALYNNSDAFDDWTVSSTTITPSGALNKTFEILFGGMAAVNTAEGNDFGALLTQGGIDRDSNGNLGVRGGTAAGIGINEGLYFGLDLSGFNTSASIQITKVYVSFAGATNESGVIVNRINPLKRITFGTSTGVDVTISNNEEAIDISSFNLFLTGGETNNSMLSVFNNSAINNNFRITGIELKVLTNQIDATPISSIAHPRLLLKQGEEALIQTLIDESAEFSNLHDFIIEKADEYLNAVTIVKPNSNRFLNEARLAIEQIFYPAYAFRMTGDAKYLTKAESVMNTVCNFTDWEGYSLEVAEMTFAVAIGYDWLYNDLSNATKINARDAILNKGIIPEKDENFWKLTSNWNQVGISGLTFGAIAIYGDGNAQMDTEAAYVLNNILVENPKSMNTYANGNYPEGTLYWGYGTTFEVMMLAALEGVYGTAHEGINRLANTPGFLESAEFMQYATGPTALYYNYMDSTQKRTPLPATFWMAKKSNNYAILSEEKKLLKNGSYNTTSDEARLLPIAMIFGKDINLSSLTDPQAKIWTGYGVQPVTMVRTDWKGSNGKYFGVKGGTPDYSHAQMDGGSFVYDSQGLRWASDFGKYDYAGVAAGIENLNSNNSHSDKTQNSARWDIFRVSNLNHNNISIKKTSSSTWQRHNVNGLATIDEIYDTTVKRGSKINLKPILNLNTELNSAFRSTYIVNDDYLEIKDEINNGSQSVDIYWNMVTTAVVETINSSSLRLTQGGKTVILEVVSTNSTVNFTMENNRSTDPVDYLPTATYERKNDGTVMVGFTATIPANASVNFTVTLKDGAIVPPSEVQATNNILLEMPSPNTGREANSLNSDKSILYIDDQGKANITGFAIEYAWKVYGETNVTAALNNQFTFNWDSMLTTNTNSGADYGALLTEGGIDRTSVGDLGVRGGTSAGIDPNEGFRLGLDVKELPNTVYLKLVKVGVGSVSGTDKGIIVNRKDTSKQKTFAASGSGFPVDVRVSNGFVDVDDLDIIIKGGETNIDLASVFNVGSEGIFRVTKFVFEMVDANTLATIWTGTSGSNWNSAGNWTNNIPVFSGDVTIPNGLTSYPTITTGATVDVNTITIESGASIIAEGTSTVNGTIIYKRQVQIPAATGNAAIDNRNGWYVLSSPVSSESYGSFITSNSLAVGSNSNVGLSTYTESNNFWDYFKTDKVGNFNSGQGYSIKRSETGEISFQGSLHTENVLTSTLARANKGFHLIGNPYTAHISSEFFLENNPAVSINKSIWTWNSQSKSYTSRAAIENFIIPPGQGFFVQVNAGGGTLSFAETNQTHNLGDDTNFQKSVQKTFITLKVKDDTTFREATVYYLEGASKGFESGYEGEVFGGIKDDFEIFTHLLEDNLGKKYQVQSLPNKDLESLVIPVGLKTTSGKEITFSVATSNLPTRIKVYLEDRKKNIFTRLDEANSEYIITLNEPLNDIGRFYFHTKSSVLNTDDFGLENINIYKINNSTLRVIGLSEGKSTLKIFNILGKQIMSKTFNSNGFKDVKLPKLLTGIYFIQLETENGKLNKKIILE